MTDVMIRLKACAYEMKELIALTEALPYERSILESIEEREYDTAISKIEAVTPD